MFKKILISFVVFGSLSNAHADWRIRDTYCADQDSNCLWCLGGGTRPNGDCNSNYAGCSNGFSTVAVGGSSNGLVCSATGFCYQTCGTRVRMEGDMQITERASGCKCDTWTVISMIPICEYGHYYSKSESKCTKCPAVKCESCTYNEFVDDDGQKWVYGNTPNMENMEITDCYLKGSCGWISNGICYDELNVYKDESGTFVIQTGTHSEGCKWEQ